MPLKIYFTLKNNNIHTEIVLKLYLLHNKISQQCNVCRSNLKAFDCLSFFANPMLKRSFWLHVITIKNLKITLLQPLRYYSYSN